MALTAELARAAAELVVVSYGESSEAPAYSIDAAIAASSFFGGSLFGVAPASHKSTTSTDHELEHGPDVDAALGAR